MPMPPLPAALARTVRPSRPPRRSPRSVSVRALLLLILIASPLSAGAAEAVARDTPGAVGAAAAVADSSRGAAPDTVATPEIEVTPGGATRVGTITAVGNHATDLDRILRSFGVQSGGRYSPDAVKRGLVKLVALGLFSDVWVEKQEHDGVVDLVIHVQERPRIARVEFKGNKRKDTSELEKKLSVHAGEIYSPGTVQTQVDSLLKFYRDEGYARIQVKAELDSTSGANQVALRFVIDEGERLQITKVVFVGANPEIEAKLHKQLKTRPRGFFGGGEIKDESFEDDRTKLEAWYHSQGYRDMRVVSHEVRPGDSPRHVTLAFTIEEGRRYFMGRVGWTGNTVVPTSELSAGLRVRPLDRYDASRIERAQAQAYAAYSERGYLSVAIEPRESVRDSAVDVTFNVAEGPPSVIRYVTITGNKNTREKVLRRELSIHEGDRFRRSSLMRSRDDLMRLGLFEDIQPDIGPADSSNVDLILKVKEKQVGTASAGAGYTGTTGLTGFLELGHNNVLGNAQTLSLHLERGAKVSNYLVSFTEPWFRDTPTLLGYSVYNTSVVRDFYRERRAGGSGKIGRPLPWPDFSRGAVTYRLENVTIDDVDTLAASLAGFTAEQVLASVKPGQPQLTSALVLDFNRNTSDNPFYPTRGSRLLTYHEFAGGPLAGDIQFNKHRVDARWYTRSIAPHVTTMLRGRFGFLGAFPNQDQSVPTYERFRLGGGSTVDPLRGYEDYQVVPEKFIHTSIDSVFDHWVYPAPGDSFMVKRPIKSTVRYPGGRFFTAYTFEQQFPIVHPLHGVLFFDAGNTWDLFHEIKPFDLKMGAGVGFRLEIPMLGNVGFDFGYGFNRDDGPRAKGHFLLGNVSF